jgi:uncharacterized protein involved in exopolysaccharide biosynthesis
MEKQRERYLLEDILVILFKHKYKILAAFFTVMVAVTIKTSLTTPVYETHSSLMIQSGRESLYRSEVGDDNERVILDLDKLINTETQILTSADLIAEVITDLGVENIYPRYDRTITERANTCKRGSNKKCHIPIQGEPRCIPCRKF